MVTTGYNLARLEEATGRIGNAKASYKVPPPPSAPGAGSPSAACVLLC
jgi:hypothetical protein